MMAELWGRIAGGSVRLELEFDDLLFCERCKGLRSMHPFLRECSCQGAHHA